MNLPAFRDIPPFEILDEDDTLQHEPDYVGLFDGDIENVPEPRKRLLAGPAVNIAQQDVHFFVDLPKAPSVDVIAHRLLPNEEEGGVVWTMAQYDHWADERTNVARLDALMQQRLDEQTRRLLLTVIPGGYCMADFITAAFHASGYEALYLEFSPDPTRPETAGVQIYAQHSRAELDLAPALIGKSTWLRLDELVNRYAREAKVPLQPWPFTVFLDQMPYPTDATQQRRLVSVIDAVIAELRQGLR